MSQNDSVKPTQIDSIGARMKTVRIEAGYQSAATFVDDFNQQLDLIAKPRISVRTYREWERIGTALENPKLIAHPPYYFYAIFCGLTGVTGYWLFYGDPGGVIKLISDLPSKNQRWINEQLMAIKCPGRQSLIREFLRLIAKISDTQRTALRNLLKVF